MSVTFEDPADVEAALLNAWLVPPPAPPSLRPGPMAELRDSMARFSRSDTHEARRSALDRLIDQIDGHPFAAHSYRATEAIIAGFPRAPDFDGLAHIGVVVPVDIVAGALGLPGESLAAVRGDVRAVAEVIGRQQICTPTADEAAARLLQCFDEMGVVDSVAAVSLLYQTHDATAALFASTLVAEQTGTIRRSAIAGTTRIATAPVTINRTGVEAGDTVDLNLEHSRFEFGLGPHRCPGRSLAERIVSGMIHAVGAAGLRVDAGTSERHGDGRPRTLTLVSGDTQA